MKPEHFKEANIVFGKGQDEYVPLPAHKKPEDAYGRVVFCWKLTFRERLKLLCTGRLWHQVLTFNQPLMPQHLGLDKPDMLTAKETTKPCS